MWVLPFRFYRWPWWRKWCEETYCYPKTQGVLWCHKRTKEIDKLDVIFAQNLEKQAVRAEVLLSGFLVEHNLPLATADHMSKLFKSTFLDSEIASKYKCGRTKTSHILTGTVTKNVMKYIKEEIVWIGHRRK